VTRWTNRALGRFLRLVGFAVVATVVVHGVGRASESACPPDSVATGHAQAHQRPHQAGVDWNAAGSHESTPDMHCCASSPCGIAVVPSVPLAALWPSPDITLKRDNRLVEAPTGRIERPPNIG
jgi:hypothetical protein